MTENERRKIIIHGREYWMTIEEMQDEFGPDFDMKIWEEAERA